MKKNLVLVYVDDDETLTDIFQDELDEFFEVKSFIT
jgi:hypothetical protein